MDLTRSGAMMLASLACRVGKRQEGLPWPTMRLRTAPTRAQVRVRSSRGRRSVLSAALMVSLMAVGAQQSTVLGRHRED